MGAVSRARWGGLALLLGVLIFIGSRFRDHVDPTDRFLAVFMTVAFVGWFVGLLAFRAQYRPRTGRLGAAGLGLTLAGIGLLAVGHAAMFLLELGGPWFIAIGLGTLSLAVGVLVFGVAALRADVLPRWRVMPLITGLVGLAWILFASDSRPVEGNPEAFLVMRTAFGICWLPLAVILLTDRRGADESTETVPARAGHRAGRAPWA